jgi:hypothetical protein
MITHLSQIARPLALILCMTAVALGVIPSQSKSANLKRITFLVDELSFRTVSETSVAAVSILPEDTLILDANEFIRQAKALSKAGTLKITGQSTTPLAVNKPEILTSEIAARAEDDAAPGEDRESLLTEVKVLSADSQIYYIVTITVLQRWDTSNSKAAEAASLPAAIYTFRLKQNEVAIFSPPSTPSSRISSPRKYIAIRVRPSYESPQPFA